MTTTYFPLPIFIIKLDVSDIKMNVNEMTMRLSTVQLVVLFKCPFKDEDKLTVRSAVASIETRRTCCVWSQSVVVAHKKLV